MENPPPIPTRPTPAQPAMGVPRLPAALQQQKDAEHLRLLEIFHYVSAGLTLLMSLWALIYVVMGGAMMTGAMPSSGSPDEMMMMGGIFFVIGVLGTLLGLAMAVCEFIAAKMMSRRKGWLFCMIIAGINCMNMPIGTALGVCTFIIMLRPSVRELFEKNKTSS